MPPQTMTKEKQYAELSAMLKSRLPVMESLIPVKYLTPDRLLKVALVAWSRSYQLQQCETNSIVRCVVQCAELGLEPNTPMGHAYLVPYRNKGTMEAQLIVGYRGLIDLGRRTGDLLQIEAHPVRKGDKFRVRYGLEPLLEHEPNWDTDAPEAVAYYAIARLSNGERQVEVMARDAVEKVKARSRAAANGPWITDFDEMAKKTVVRRMMKYLPMNPHVTRAMELDQDTEGAEEIQLNEPPTQAPTKTERLKAELAGPIDPGSAEAPEEEAQPAEEAKEAKEAEAPSDDLTKELEGIAAALDAAKSKEELKPLRQRISALPPDQRTAVTDAFNKRSRELGG